MSYSESIKPILDTALAALLLVILAPILVSCVLLLLICGHPRVFFVQKRVGKGEVQFNCLKFTSMTDGRDSTGLLLPDSQRITTIGKFLRSSSLDELPQLYNVLRGEMSLVGPRPLPPEYLGLYNAEQRLRHAVRPGITGLAQINGRNSLDWQTRFNYDLLYVQKISFLLDLKIILITPWTILRRNGISSSGHVSGQPFRGNVV